MTESLSIGSCFQICVAQGSWAHLGTLIVVDPVLLESTRTKTGNKLGDRGIHMAPMAPKTSVPSVHGKEPHRWIPVKHPLEILEILITKDFPFVSRGVSWGSTTVSTLILKLSSQWKESDIFELSQ